MQKKTDSRHILGDWGEQQALDYLAQKGYQVVASNFRAARAQVDLIVQKKNLIVFVEVKTRSSIRFGYGEQTVTERQKELILEAAHSWQIQNNWHGSIRFDILAIHLQTGAALPQIDHFEDAF